MAEQEEVNALAEIRKSYIDPETQEKVTVTTEMTTALAAHEEQIFVSTIAMAISLKAIRDNKLYLLRSCDSMKEYALRFLGKSYSSAKFYLHLADAFDGISNKDQLKGLKVGQLGAISSDLLLVEKLKKGDAEITGDKIVFASGETESLDEHLEFVRSAAKGEAQAEIAKATKATAKVRGDLRQIKQLAEAKDQEILEKDEKIAQLEAMVDEIGKAKDIDPRKLRALNSKKDASDLIRSVSERVFEALGELSTIPHEIIDPELAGYLQTCIASSETSLKKAKADFAGAVHFDLSEAN